MICDVLDLSLALSVKSVLMHTEALLPDVDYELLVFYD